MLYAALLLRIFINLVVFQGDPVKDLLLKHFGEEDTPPRKSLTVESVPFDESGLRQLLVSEES